jgi:hypothetical protein
MDPQLGTKDLPGPESRILIKKHLVRARDGPNPIFVKASEEGFAEWGEWFIKVLHDQGLQRLVGSQKQIYVGSSAGG